MLKHLGGKLRPEQPVGFFGPSTVCRCILFSSRVAILPCFLIAPKDPGVGHVHTIPLCTLNRFDNYQWASET